MNAVREATPADLAAGLDRLVRETPRIAAEVLAIGIPILLASGELLRGPEVILPANAEDVPITDERLEKWVENGWVDLRESNCRRWIERFEAIHDETTAVPADDTSSRYLRNRRFWSEDHNIQPGKVVGWILSVEEKGDRLK